MLFSRLQRILPQWPSRCAVCHAWPSQALCEACVHRFAQPQTRCTTCALALPGQSRRCGACVLSPNTLEACVAAVSYEYPWASLIADFKFRRQPGWARSFALLLRSAPWVDPALEQADWLIPMPLSAQRLRQRGFNQALELARQLAPERTHANLLLRLRDTPAQVTLSRELRQANLRGAFAVEPQYASLLRGKRVVLLDDVMTSGASLYTAAHTLRQAGASHITGMVIARTE